MQDLDKYIAHINKEAKQMSYVKDLFKSRWTKLIRCRTKTGKHGTQKYVIKQGENKGKIV